MKAIHLLKISATLSLLAVVLLFAGTASAQTATGTSSQAVFYVA